MTEELAVPVSRDIVVPGTGEVVNLDDAPAVARALAALREHKRQADEIRVVLEQALIAESSRVGSKTLRYGDHLVASVSGGSEIQWDVTELVKLLDAGLPQDRYDELVTETVSYKVDGTVARQLVGANPAYAKIIEAAKVRVPKRVYVKVEAT